MNINIRQIKIELNIMHNLFARYACISNYPDVTNTGDLQFWQVEHKIKIMLTRYCIGVSSSEHKYLNFKAFTK